MRPSSRKPKFAEPRYFSSLGDPKRWTCDICSASPTAFQRNGMPLQAALKHEETRQHRENVRARQEWNPPPDTGVNSKNGLFESRVTEQMQHVDQLRDFIPFWRRTIEAAEYGETLRFEDFLNTLQKKDEEEIAWNVAVPEWALGPWKGAAEAEQRSTGAEHDQLSEASYDVDFVDRIAKMDSASSERRERLRSFYKVPTNEKVDRINELIDALRMMQATS